MLGTCFTRMSGKTMHTHDRTVANSRYNQRAHQCIVCTSSTACGTRAIQSLKYRHKVESYRSSAVKILTQSTDLRILGSLNLSLSARASMKAGGGGRVEKSREGCLRDENNTNNNNHITSHHRRQGQQGQHPLPYCTRPAPASNGKH